MAKTRQRLAAVTLGLTLAGGGALLADELSPFPVWLRVRESLGMLPGEPAAWEPLGFRAHWIAPPTRELEPGEFARCGFGLGGPTSWPWFDGPHAGFAHLSPEVLANSSLEWFHGMPDAPWRVDPTARIGLEYAIESGTASVRSAPTSEHTWEEQLRAWFQYLPPSDNAEARPARWLPELYDWGIEFGNFGSVRGEALTAELAIAAMRTLADSEDAWGLLQPTEFSLGWLRRHGDRTADYTSQSVHRRDELDQLPARLGAHVGEWTELCPRSPLAD